jgi:hypothetical protein
MMQHLSDFSPALQRLGITMFACWPFHQCQVMLGGWSSTHMHAQVQHDCLTVPAQSAAAATAGVGCLYVQG